MQVTDEELRRFHRYFGVETNNAAWALIEKHPLEPAEEEELIRLAYASVYHWSVVGKPINLGRGLGTVSRALICVGRDLITALNYAKRYRASCDAPDGELWDFQFAESGLARAYAALGNETDARTHYELAVKALEPLDDEDRRICERDLTLGPWFDLAVLTS